MELDYSIKPGNDSALPMSLASPETVSPILLSGGSALDDEGCVDALVFYLSQSPMRRPEIVFFNCVP